jgi:hypothetical protein
VVYLCRSCAKAGLISAVRGCLCLISRWVIAQPFLVVLRVVVSVDSVVPVFGSAALVVVDDG